MLNMGFHGQIQIIPSGGPYNVYQCISQKDIRTSLKKQFDPRGLIASGQRIEPIFLRKPIATSDFPVGVQTLIFPISRLDPPMFRSHHIMVK